MFRLRNYSFLHHYLLFCRNVMFQKRILRKPKWGAQAAVRGGTAPPGPPWRRHSNQLNSVNTCSRSE